MAYATGAYSYQQIADYFGMHFISVGRIVRDGKDASWLDLTYSG